MAGSVGTTIALAASRAVIRVAKVFMSYSSLVSPLIFCG
jgi:hypothetical protein